MQHHGILSLAPAALAIALAVITRNVVLSLFSAVALAGIIHLDWDVLGGIAHALDSTVIGAIADKSHAKTILFIVLIGAMVGVIGKSGATRAVVQALARRAKSRRSVQMLSWLSGMVVFFDDYTNCMIVGSAMQPLCDKHRVSRPKLAYIVDSTAAPVASLALISTWVGFEVGVIEKGLEKAGIQTDAYAFFVEGWAYRFYAILAMLFVGIVAWTGRDFGPMHKAASAVGQPDPQSELLPPPRGGVWLAALPILTLLVVTMTVLWSDGTSGLPPDAKLFEILGNADGVGAIAKGSFAALTVALVLSVAVKALTPKAATEAAIDGVRLLIEALIVLILAWGIGSAMGELGAPEYLVQVLHARLPVPLLPTVVFIVAAITSFATGTSYGTMGILMPMVIPLAFKLAPDSFIPLAASGSVLAGACFGDHCSPISDTTILSSIGSGSDLLAHVRTQLPYALGIGVISIVFGTLPAGYGISPWLLIVVGVAASYVLLRVFGKLPSEVSGDGGGQGGGGGGAGGAAGGDAERPEAPSSEPEPA